MLGGPGRGAVAERRADGIKNAPAPAVNGDLNGAGSPTGLASRLVL
jgi:hypothetical protein